MVRGIALAAALFIAVACAEFVTDPGTADRGVRGIQLDSLRFSLDDGQSRQLVPTVLDQLGKPFDAIPTGLKVLWVSSSTDILTVDDKGMLTAVHPGTAKVSASISGNFGRVDVSADVLVLQVPTTIVVSSGDNQQAQVGEDLAQPLKAKVTDKWGDGVPHVGVNFAAKTGGGTLSAATDTSDASGVAKATLTLGTIAGTQTVEAT